MLQLTHDSFLLQHNYIIIALCIRYLKGHLLGANTSFMASIQGWTEALVALFHEHSSCLSWPTQYLAVYSNDSSFMLNPPLPTGQLNTHVQVNNTAMLHHIYTDTHIYITFILLFILFLILLPLYCAGYWPRLFSSVTFVYCHFYICSVFFN